MGIKGGEGTMERKSGRRGKRKKLIEKGKKLDGKDERKIKMKNKNREEEKGKGGSQVKFSDSNIGVPSFL